MRGIAVIFALIIFKAHFN